MKKRALIAGMILCIAGVLQAQRGFEVGGAIGLSNYFGDLNTTYSLQRIGPAAALIARYNFNERICLKFAGKYGRLQAYDSDSDNTFQRSRNLSFRTAVVDASIQWEFNFFPYIHGSEQYYYTPYILLGGGVYYANPKAELDGEWVPLQPMGTEGQPIGGEYSLVHPAISYGIGFKADLSYYLSLNIELSGRSLFTDYIDDVSTTYPNQFQLRNLRGIQAPLLSDRSGEVLAEPLGETGRQRGNSKNNDAYAFLTVGIVYYLGNVQCPAISRPKSKPLPRKRRSR
jgi:hypothetical protein